ncbi:RNA-directed DNA polymerase (Reverse transcriptase) [Trifolium medium]|uniref:RNA-directed DNA polymerase (Reverse transcriptase) n=1 Tax=Trifolium medium TaxID=97028 RepID=A0A392N431_9FABA|nr:RNA-directed DNA polymerase (Reverse transcriptase) [Trifolium medium]
MLYGYTASSDVENRILHHFHISPKLRNTPKITLVLWKAPFIRWIKVNTDGSVTNTPISASCGGIFRNHLADFMGCFAKNLDNVTVLHAEIMLGLNVARSHIYRKGTRCADTLANHGRLVEDST